MANIRDFIYLDHRRVLSIGSQLLEGLADSIVVNEEQRKATEKKLDTKGKIPGQIGVGDESGKLLNLLVGVLGKGELGISGEINPLFSSVKTFGETRTEQRVLDHHQFTLLRNALMEQNLLKELDQFKQSDWNNGSVLGQLKPGEFIELTCRVKLLDVKHLESIANSMERLFDMMQQMSLSEKAEEKFQAGESLDDFLAEIAKAPVTMGYESTKKTLGDGINPLQFNAILELMKNISEEGFSSIPVQVIARPKSISKSGTKFVAPIRTEYLIDTKEELIFKYGYEPEQDWILLGQVCKIPKNRKKQIDFNRFNSSNFAAFDQVLEQLTDSFMDLSLDIGMHSFVRHPNVSINLIGLYR